jgi:bifunctional non-homologous end joining protein LigD
VSAYILPHLKDRPLTLSRYPGGIDGEHFWQKHWTHPLPDYVTTVNILSEETGKPGEYLVCDNLPTLLWLGQLADIELHTWFSRISPEPDLVDAKQKRDTEFLLERPDFIIFDLDPYIYSGQEAKGAEPELNRKAFDHGCQVALWLKEVLDRLGLAAFVKTSGKTGLHIYVPIVRKLDYRAVRKATETIGQFILALHPNEVTMERAPQKRTGRVYIDYAQNVRGKTLASAYSARPLPLAPVSMPLKWDELGKIYPTDFTILTAPDRLERTGDTWADILAAKRDLAEALDKPLSSI